MRMDSSGGRRIVERMNRASVLLVCLLSSGCFLQRSLVDRPFAEADVARIGNAGATTAKEVVARLGAPTEVVQLGRRSAYLYLHEQEKTAGLFLLVAAFNNRDRQTDRVWVFFDEHDVVTHVGRTLQAQGAEYAMPWVAHD